MYDICLSLPRGHSSHARTYFNNNWDREREGETGFLTILKYFGGTFLSSAISITTVGTDRDSQNAIISLDFISLITI